MCPCVFERETRRERERRSVRVCLNGEKQLIVELYGRMGVHPERHRAGRREIWRGERRSLGEKQKKSGVEKWESWRGGVRGGGADG